MNRDSIERRARLAIARTLHVQLGQVTDAREFRNGEQARAWSALEAEFGIKVTTEQVSFCRTVGTAIDFVETRLENRGLMQ